jgi:two-component system, NarL family, nitrate/nitrite response regulator NarL
VKSKIRVAVVDDHPLLCEGVIHILKGVADIDVVAKGATAKDAVDIVASQNPDALVLDISIPGGGLNALQTIMEQSPKTKVLMLTVSADESDVLNALRLGAKGYVLKGVSGPELVQALRAVYLDGQYISPSLGAKLLLDVGRGKSIAKGNLFEDLSSRQDEILLLVGQGLSNKEIGARLHLSDRTIKHHMTNVFQKLGVRNRLEAALLVRQKTQRQDKDLQS